MQELNSLIDFSHLKSQRDSAQAFQKARDYINYTQKGKPDKEVAKRRSHELLKFMDVHLNSPAASATSKFHTLSILRLATENDERTILSVLSNHSLLRYLVGMAKSTDPRLPIDQKGKKLFSDTKAGNNYMRLILQSIKVWGEKFSSNKKNEASRYKLAYDELVREKVVMPEELRFYSWKGLGSGVGVGGKGVMSEMGEATRSDRTGKMEVGREVEGDNGSLYNNKGKIMQEDLAKISQYMQKLSQGEQGSHHHTYHKLFTQQIQRYLSLIDNIVASNRQKDLDMALAINEFYLDQTKAYESYIRQKPDYYSYVKQVEMIAEELYGKVRKTPIVGEVIMREVTTKEVTIMQARSNNLLSSSNPDNNYKALVSKLQSQLASQSSANTFKNIKESLSKDKTLSRATRSISGTKRSTSKLSRSFSKSRIAQIFHNPPNRYPKDKRYFGKSIAVNREMQRTMREITRSQGHRRFITSQFKNKNPLFENSHLQVGFKSESVYEQVSEFWAVLNIQLFIGNKTQTTITNLSIDYKGEANILLYGNPKKVEGTLPPGVQIKQELVIAPLDNRPTLIKMYVRYEVNGEGREERIVMPNSIVKFVENSKLSKKEFVQYWNGATIYKTDEFKLTRFIAPDSLPKYIAMLEELSSYESFSEPGSETDYELGCQVVLKKRYDGVLRISIRPNLNAVVQIGILGSAEDTDAQEAFVHYAQTLQMILSAVEN